jgi:ADP-heptose:LPS heptosyltransferase
VKILLIRLRLIGDVVFTTPAIRAVARRFPGARVSYLVEPHASPVVLGNPLLDEVIVAPRPAGRIRIWEDVPLAARLRAARYDLVIDFHGGPRAAWLALATGAPRRIGYTVAGRGWMYTERVPRARGLRPRHSVENQWDLLAPLGIPPPDPEVDATEMREVPEARARVAAALEQAGVAEADRVVIIHVSAGNPFRRWPPESFVGLVIRLAASVDCRIVLTSGPSDAAAANRVREEAARRLPAGRRTVIVRTPELDLAELRSLAGRAALFIGGDSGPLHVAGTTGTPIVALFGPTLAARSAPWRPARYATESLEVHGLACRPCEQRRCVSGDYRCLGGLTVEAVFGAAERALARAGAGAGRGVRV